MQSDNSLNKSLFEICRAMTSSLEIPEVLDTILHLSAENLKAASGSILLYEEGSENLKMLASRGLPPNVVKRGHLHRKGSIAEWVIENDQPIIVNKRSDIFPEEQDTEEETSAIKSALCVPLHAKGKIIGVINLNRYQDSDDVFHEDDLNILTILAGQAAICIDNARLYEQNMQQARMAAIGQTVAGISHCVKNMLTGLRGGLGILELAEGSKDWETVNKATGFIKGNVERISMLVMDMLDYSREKQPSRKNTDLDKLTKEVLSVVHYKAEMQEIELFQEVDPDARVHSVDSDQIFRCVLNLLENAIDAFEHPGKVTIRCLPLSETEAKTVLGGENDVKAYGKTVKITVEDNGVGIDPENLDHIFQPFFSTKKSKGTGLGLAVTWKIVSEHGGRILVDSEPGKGTAFHLVLPEKNPNVPDDSEEANHPADSPTVS